MSTYKAKCGIATYTGFLGSALMKLGHDVMIFGEKTTENEPSPVPGVMCYDRNDQNSYIQLAQEADKWKPDVMHWQYEWALHQSSGPVFELANERPHFLTWHNIIPDSKSYWYGHLADRNIVHSEVMAQNLPRLQLSPAIVSHGTRENKVTNRYRAKEALGIPGDRKVIASFGFSDPRKGFHIITSSWPRIRERCPEAFYLVVGGRHPKNSNLSGFYRMFEDQMKQYPDDFMQTGYLSDEDQIDLVLSAADVMMFANIGGQEALSVSGSIHRVIDHAPILVVQDMPFYSDIPEDCCVRIPLGTPFIPWGRWLGKLLADSDDEKYELMKTQLKLYAMRTYWSKVAERHVMLYQDVIDRRKELR